MRPLVKLMLFAAMSLCGVAASGQENYEFYRQRANEYLQEGNCDKAQELYDLWQELAKARDTQIEARIAACKKGGVSINGVVWATRNVASPGTFAARPENPGMFYQWNRKKGWPATGDVAGWNASNAYGDAWAPANDPCPEGWRLPTREEIGRLADSGGEWTTVNGVSGYRFGSGNNTVFFPSAGMRRHITDISGAGDTDSVSTDPGTVGTGGYWSSSTSSPAQAWFMIIASFGASQANSERRLGLPVRCVSM